MEDKVSGLPSPRALRGRQGSHGMPKDNMDTLGVRAGGGNLRRQSIKPMDFGRRRSSAASIAASAVGLESKRPKFTIWPEWNDVDVNAEKWFKLSLIEWEETGKKVNIIPDTLHETRPSQHTSPLALSSPTGAMNLQDTLSRNLLHP